MLAEEGGSTYHVDIIVRLTDPHRGSMSDPEHWERVKRLFHLAAELDPAARSRFLDEEVGDDPEARARVEELLAADADASEFLESGAGGIGAGGASDGRWIGRRFGPYEVVGELGRGGMGVVLLGERSDGRYRRQVALKVVPATLVQGHLAARFRSEVRILAELDHPNIARLLDAGETDEGLAYLVMEYVDGPRIDVFADDRSLDIRARLALFRAVLDGVDYAHAHGVVHRDLKPSNILVTQDGVPKLVDFGIAKLLSPSDADDETVVLTRTAMRMMTPEYASPEQVRGEPIDARSDVYSLGVVLYRLLTGRAPYSLDSTAPRAAERVICEASPSRPSDAVTRTIPLDPEATRPATDPDVLARQRSSTQDRLQRSLRGDLDTIVLHALAKDPARRYSTAGAFADDLDRHLDGRVIRARNPSALYRAQRFVRRRWLPIAVSAAVALGVMSVAWQAREAHAQRQIAEANSAELTDLVSSVLVTLNTDLAGENQGPTATRVAAVEAAVTSLDTLLARTGGNPSPKLLGALARAYQDVGRLQGHPTSANVGRIADAERSFTTSLALWGRVAAIDGADSYTILKQVELQVLLADIARTGGRNTESADLLRRAEATVDSLADTMEPDPVLLSTQAMVYERLVSAREGVGELAAAVDYAGRLTDLARRTADLAPEGPARLGALEEVVLSLQMESYMASKAGQFEASIEAQLGATALADSIVAVPGATQRMRSIRSGAWHQLGWRYNDADRPAEAEKAFDRAIETARALVAEDPKNQGAQAALGQYVEGRGQARIRGERWEAALVDHAESIAILTPLLETLPATAFVVAQAHRERGEAYSRLGRWTEAEAEYDTSIEMAERLFQSDTTFAPARKILALSHFSRALSHRLRVQATGSTAFCSAAAESAGVGEAIWEGLRERGQIFPSEELIWSDFESMMPRGVCTLA